MFRSELIAMFWLCVSACDGGAPEVDRGIRSDSNDSLDGQDTTVADEVGAYDMTDPCPVLNNQTCSSDCVPIYSFQSEDVECSIGGVFMGCATPWLGIISLDVDSICAVLRSDVDHRYYCLHDDQGVRWFYDHLDLFCVGDPPCPGEPMVGCIK